MANYDSDILEWSERQADLLRRRAAGELVNEAEMDWPNIAEEIEGVGRGELRLGRSALRQALRCVLKAEAWPDARDAPTWRADAIAILALAVSTVTAWMTLFRRGRISMTRPAVIYFGPDGSRYSTEPKHQKVFFRAPSVFHREEGENC